ncbi:MAG TPA: Asp-tRNA(Asn)/Glu-tRNA(Gln) amidotransferase GatCAB subunit B, partial [Armatimonadota bacterium]|nr:Asp-tRNA(Asn)/Glu-tRNA(Gln) amidotransferase GatCAB subunit B [Armatimonadota bacterium]
IAKDVFETMFETGQAAATIVDSGGLEVVGGEDELGPIIDQVIAENAAAVADYREGKKKAKGALVGGVMKLTKGQADPQQVNRLIDEKLLS